MSSSTRDIDDHIMKKYDIKRRIGKGAYGIVWKAVDKRSKEVVAVKKIFDAFRNQTDAQRTFREIMFLQEFRSHPNIVCLHNIHRAANNKDIYLVFEFMETDLLNVITRGNILRDLYRVTSSTSCSRLPSSLYYFGVFVVETDLHNVIKRGNILRDLHKRYITYQLLKATKYIHSGNVIHRDLKPSNILLNTQCDCKVADFGLARSVVDSCPGEHSPAVDPALTDYVATRWYRAPEILIASKRYTKGIDMWSVGCILGEMLLGRPLFPGSSTVNQVERIMAAISLPSQKDVESVCSGYGRSLLCTPPTGPRQPLSELLQDSPSDGIDLVLRLLVFNPYKRLTAAQALRHPYVARFHNLAQEAGMGSPVVPVLCDDVQLSVDEYRRKLYEVIAVASHSRLVGGDGALALPGRRLSDSVVKAKKGSSGPILNGSTTQMGASRRSLHSGMHAVVPLERSLSRGDAPQQNLTVIKETILQPPQLVTVKAKMRPSIQKVTNYTKPFVKVVPASGDFVRRGNMAPRQPTPMMTFNTYNQRYGCITTSELNHATRPSMRW